MFDPLQIPHVFRASAGQSRARDVIASGCSELDEALGGGWPTPALIEILVDVYGMGELQVLLTLLRTRVVQTTQVPLIVWLNPPYLPNAVALEQSKVRAIQWLVRNLNERDVLWAAEQCVRSNACAVVLAWIAAPNTAMLRRLKLAVMSASHVCIVFRRLRDSMQPSPANVRMALRPECDGLRVDVIKNEGRKPASVLLDVRASSHRVFTS